MDVVWQLMIDISDTYHLQVKENRDLHWIVVDCTQHRVSFHGPRRSKSLFFIKTCIQVLTVHHPPVAAGMLHGLPARSGCLATQNESVLQHSLRSLPGKQSLFRRVCNVVKHPHKPLNHLKMFMRRYLMQDEYCRRLLTGNSTLVSTLMQPGSPLGKPTVHDLHQYIADDPQMSDSTELIELVVANKIVKLKA